MTIMYCHLSQFVNKDNGPLNPHISNYFISLKKGDTCILCYPYVMFIILSICSRVFLSFISMVSLPLLGFQWRYRSIWIFWAKFISLPMGLILMRGRWPTRGLLLSHLNANHSWYITCLYIMLRSGPRLGCPSWKMLIMYW